MRTRPGLDDVVRFFGGEEKGTGYFSTSFRVPSSSPQHRREAVPTSKTLNIDVIYGMSKAHPDREWESTVRGDGKAVLFGVS